MKNIAIIGSGISGLVSAYLLKQKHQIKLFECNDYIGGHTATKEVELDGRTYAIDTGFIVFNNHTYPLFLRLLAEIGVERQETEMSFSVHNSLTGLEYNGHDLNTLFAQRRNMLRPKFWKLIRDILRFNKLCKQISKDISSHSSQYHSEYTLGQFLIEHNFSDFFNEHYILPMGAAIWSTSLTSMLEFQLEFFIRFFDNHGLLNINDRPQWYVVPGGSKQYIPPLIASFEDDIELNAKIAQVKRNGKTVSLLFKNGEEQVFDEVVFACHSDQALKLLGDASELEQKILGDIPYSNNDVVLHTDTKLLPKRKLAWASWNYLLDDNPNAPAAVTYDMNILQGIKSEHTFCVTLNKSELIDDSKVLGRYQYSHPVFNVTSQKAKQRRSQICGHNHTHFVGAYWYNGFHEDGVRSAVEMAQRFDCQLGDTATDKPDSGDQL